MSRFRNTEHGDTTFFRSAILPKLEVSTPDDPFEVEADSTADRIMQMTEGGTSFAPAGADTVQRHLQSEPEEEEKVQAAPISTIQRQAEDEREEEEPVMASRDETAWRSEDPALEEEEVIQPKSEGRISRQPLEEEEETVQAAHIGGRAPPSFHVQRASMPADEGAAVRDSSENYSETHLIQANRERGPPGTSHAFEQQLDNSKSGGQPLDPGTQDFMESRFGADFSGVRVHSDVRSQEMTRSINAHAFAHGSHIYFNSGKYDTQSFTGKRLLAHELTHTIQQGASPRAPPSAQRTQVQRKATHDIVQRQAAAPQLDAAVELAKGEEGKVIANDTGPDGNRVGWERLLEYFKTSFGEDKIVSSPNGVQGTVWEGHIKKRSEFMGMVPNQPDQNKRELRDAMPSWCGIFAFWSLNKAGVSMPKWELGGAMIDLSAGYPPGYTPKPGDIAYRERRSHYGLVVGMEGPNRVITVNGNTAGADNLGGEVQVQTHSLDQWTGFFNPLALATGNLRDPDKGDDETEPRTLRELRKEKFNVHRSADADEMCDSDCEIVQASRQSISHTDVMRSPVADRVSEEEEEETIQASLDPSAASLQYSPGETAPGETSIEPGPANSSRAPPVLRTSRPIVQGSWLGDAWNAVTGLASTVADLIEEGLDAAKDWLLEQVRDFVIEIPGYKLLSIILGYDPITGQDVQRTPTSLLEGVLDIIPLGGALVRRVLDYFNATVPVANWLMGAVEGFISLIRSVGSRFERFWDDLSIDDVADPEAVIDRIANLFRGVVTDIVDFVAEVGGSFLTMVKEIAINNIAMFVQNHFPNAFPLLTVILGENPITKEPVDRTGANILTAGLRVLGERGDQIRQQMMENGIFQKCAAWIDRSFQLVLDVIQDIGTLFDSIWEAISFESLSHPVETFTEIAENFSRPILRITSFITDAVVSLLAILRDALVDRLSRFARDTRGYFLITVLIGQDPFTGRRVERNTENIIHGFMSLMEGGEEQFQQMKQSGAIDRMTARVSAAIKALNFTLAYVLGLFTSLWESLDWNDFLNPIGVFRRIVATFGQPVIRLVRFVIEIIKIVIEILLVVMNFPVDLIQNIITRTLEVIDQIKRDPIGFLKNLLRAIKQGFIQFFDNILSHLLRGLADWLFGSLGDIGIQPPADLSFRSILNLVLQILGISVERIMEKVWAKLAEQIGQDKVDKIKNAIDRLTGIWTFIKDVIERGPIAIWEFIQEKISDLWNMVLEAARNWIMTRIIESVVTKLLSMLDPTGIMAVINSAIAIYRAVQSFIQYLREMLEIVNSFVNGVAELASGNIAVAADYLERTMARGIPIVIGFLANQVGLGNIGRKIAEIIGAIRTKIDEAIDWLIAKALRIGRPIIDGIIRVIEFGEGLVERGREAAASALGALMPWRTMRKSFNDESGSAHRIYFEERGETPVLMVASDPAPASTFLSNIETGGDANKQAALTQATTLVRSIDEEKARPLSGNTDAEKQAAANQRQQRIQGWLNQLSTHLSLLFGGGVPESVINHSSSTMGGATQGVSMEATVLTRQGPVGSEPTQQRHNVFDNINLRRYGNGSYYIRGHLLNHNIHGVGQWINMTPLSRRGNSSHEKDVESKVKEKVDAGKVVAYRVQPVYGRSVSVPNNTQLEAAGVDPAHFENAKKVRQYEAFVPLSLQCQADEIEMRAGSYQVVRPIVSANVDNPVETDLTSYQFEGAALQPVVLSRDSADHISQNTGIEAAQATEVKNAIAAILAAGTDVTTYDQLAAQNTAINSETLATLRRRRNVRLN